MAISVTDPISSAWNHAKLVCFKPFDMGKWFAMGFCAWLAQLGQGGFNFNFPGSSSGSGSRGSSGRSPDPSTDDFKREIQPIIDWILANLPLVIGIGVAILLAIIALTILMMWLSSRGQFMLLDGVVHNRGSVTEPWKRLRWLGNSLFGFKLWFALATLAGLGVIGAAAVLPALAVRPGSGNGTALIVGFSIGIPLLLAWIIALAVAQVVLIDFVVPVMYLRQVRVMEAWSIARHQLLPGNVGSLVLYLLMRLVLGIAVAVAILGLVCGTCCLALCVMIIPVIGTIALLPIWVFLRSYPLYVLEQFGENWQVFPTHSDPEVASDTI